MWLIRDRNLADLDGPDTEERMEQTEKWSQVAQEKELEGSAHFTSNAEFQLRSCNIYLACDYAFRLTGSLSWMRGDSAVG